MFIDIFQEARKGAIEKKEFIFRYSESQKPNSDLLVFIDQIKKVDPSKVYRYFNKHIKRKYWEQKLVDVFAQPSLWV
jgi:hypothetical protein